MEVALGAFTPGFSTFSLQFIDRSFDHRLIRKKWVNNLPDLLGESGKGLPKLAEFFLIPGCLYAHIYISIKILNLKKTSGGCPCLLNTKIKTVLPGINHDVVAFVMARWQESGGFGLAPTLPASVEDTYHALKILETIRPVSEKEFEELKKSPQLKAFLMRKQKEGKESWSLRTGYQYLALCAFCGAYPNKEWFERFLGKRPKRDASLSERYYLARIRREFLPAIAELLRRASPNAHFIDCGGARNGRRAENWRTVDELWMCLYLHEGSPEPLHTTKKALVQWLQACQTPDGGFGFLPGTTSFIENSQRCLRALALLKSAPLSLDMARDFILWCKTRGGGFARKPKAAPFLFATWHAVASLSLLQIPPKGQCSYAFTPSP